jgi:hypothetical protein
MASSSTWLNHIEFTALFSLSFNYNVVPSALFFPFFLHIPTNVTLSLLTMNKFWIATCSKLRKGPLNGTWDVGDHIHDYMTSVIT